MLTVYPGDLVISKRGVLGREALSLLQPFMSTAETWAIQSLSCRPATKRSWTIPRR